MAQIIIKPKMTLDQAVNARRTEDQDKAYLELMNVWTNQRD